MPVTITKRGRPKKSAEERRGYSLSANITDELKGKLDTAAKSSGRSLSHEVEFRLEMSFEHDEFKRLSDGKSEHVVGDPGAQKLLATLGSAAGLISERNNKNWWEDPETYDAVCELWKELLVNLRPADSIMYYAKHSEPC